LALVPGTRLGVYEVTAQIGEGGMGQVYRARDTKLNRDVALKILPDAVGNDPDRLARFTREAQTLASLNHPNIAHIHGLEESNGGRALVMELVEGEDLSQRIARGAIPVDEALPLARQIAEALEAAHEKGIVHRDLKPANIKVRPDGTAKVLDFGLAKAMEPAAGSSPNVSHSPTLATHAMTQTGMILGTAAYMSPEQARGTTADKRADLWGFGVVLWEMLTGKRLFEGATVSDTLASVLKTEPDWNALAPTTHPAIRRLLRRCLEKDRRRRLSDAADARLEIDEALNTPSAAADPTPPSSAGSKRQVTTIAGGALLVGALATALTMSAFVGRAPATKSWYGVLLGGPQVSVSPRPSPDGQLLAFVGNDVDDVMQVWVTKPDTGNRIMLTHSRERGYVQGCSWSADGNRIYYDRWLDGPKGVFSVPALGGEEQLVLEDAMFPDGLADGSLLVVRVNPEHRQLFRYWPDSGKLQGFAVQPTAELSAPRAVPGGRLALVIGMATTPGAERGVHAWVVDLLSGELRSLSVDLSNATNFSIAATRDGTRALIGFSSGSLYRVVSIPLGAAAADKDRPTTLLTLTLWASTLDAGPEDSIYVEQNDRPVELVRFALGSSVSDGGAGRAAGVHVERIATLASAGQTLHSDYFAVLPDGRAVWAEVNGGRRRVMVVEAGKDPLPLVSTSEETWGPMTAVGTGEVAFMAGSQGKAAIGVAALANGRIIRQLAFDKGFVSSMAASPDGHTIYAVAEGLVWAVPVSGEAPRKIRSGDGVAVDIATRSLVVFVQQPGGSRLIRVPLGGGPEQEVPGSFRVGGVIDPGSIRNGRLVSALAGPYWYWPPGIFDLAAGTSERIPLDYTQDFHHMAWTPDGKVMAVAVGFRGSIWKFTPEGK
jgi:serine/threonine protein kinase